MVSSRKSRILALSAFLLTIVFIFIQTHNNKSLNDSIIDKTDPSSNKPNLESTTNQIGAIDESKIKSNEEKLNNKLNQNDGKDDSNVEIKQKQKQKQEGITDESNIKTTFDAAQEFQSIIGLSPVVIFSKTYCGFSQALKNLLKFEYEINPPPTIVELDKHKNGRELQDFIASKSGRKTVPNLFINGVSRGGSDEMKKLHDEGKLLESLNLWGEKGIKVNKINAPSNS
ncbi:Monothiol glutaredoxin-7 [Wickerhamomyces ciferrii]|uniref:Monothiol glutaredoxin-7 n=1 Tax=Wickerhamomyces ciferrii (strain ATCC 14091 / BCRC 22168 / CBS 111 / JCM 3599 / NBRC 0793 / NRRL Y-1031 F-60-10) TaxID=1206466 RepID=K0KEL7_WICCF|nr:Monothiol glutaredoxin-7 [Wickerhamomyces ciferrii]CCH41361.1 Monothiol glutaredoxin-7 [Wickerhamomyces ciferrii]